MKGEISSVANWNCGIGQVSLVPSSQNTRVEVVEYTMGNQQTPGCGRWGHLTAALVWLIGLGNVVMGQGLPTPDPVKTTCNILFARGVVAGNKMYLDGGELMDESFYDGGKDEPQFNQEKLRWQSECP